MSKKKKKRQQNRKKQNKHEQNPDQPRHVDKPREDFTNEGFKNREESNHVTPPNKRLLNETQGSEHVGGETLGNPTANQSDAENLHLKTDDAKQASNYDMLKRITEWLNKTPEPFDTMSVRSDNSKHSPPRFCGESDPDTEIERETQKRPPNRNKPNKLKQNPDLTRRLHKTTQTDFTNKLKNSDWISLDRRCTWMAFVVVVVIALFIMLHLAFKGKEIDHHELRVMLVGKTGAGKSASGNTILGEEAFRVEASPASVSPGCEKKNKVVDGRNITVIDTPGVMDTWLMSDQEAHSAHKCISMIVSGPHVFLLVIRIGRFTEEEVNAVKWIQENFGEVAVKFTMILFTGGDLLEGKPIQKFISNSVELRNLVDTCNSRYHVFSNYDRSDRAQVTELFQKIKLMLHENMGYIHTNEVYGEVQQTVREEEELKKKELMRTLKEEEIRNIENREEEIRKEEELKKKAPLTKMKEEKIKLENRAEEFRKEEELKWSQAVEEMKADEQKKLNRIASELRNEQYENMKLKAELKEVQIHIFWAMFIVIPFIIVFIIVTGIVIFRGKKQIIKE